MNEQANINTVSEDILSDWRNRTVVSVSELRWADENRTMLNCNVLFQELSTFGPIPFTTVKDADTEHGLEIWQKASDGEYGPIAAFVAPPVIYPDLTARQLRLGLNSLGKLAVVEAAINQLPDPAKSEAKIEWEFASTFRRDHPLIIQISPILNLSNEQIDAVWLEYSQV